MAGDGTGQCRTALHDEGAGWYGDAVQTLLVGPRA